MNETTSQRRATEDREGRAPRQSKRKRDAQRAEHETSDPAAFRAAATATAAIPAGKARHQARETLLKSVLADSKIKSTAKVAFQTLLAGVYWKTGCSRISTTALAQGMSVNRSTATRAISQLRDRGHIVRLIEKCGDSKENETAKTAFPGLPEMYRQSTSAGSVEVGAGLHLPRRTSAPTGRCSDAPEVGAGMSQSQSLVGNPGVESPGQSSGAHERADRPDLSNPILDEGLTVPAATAQPPGRALVPVEGKTGSATQAPVVTVRPHNERTALAKSNTGVVAGGLPTKYPFTDRPDITYLIEAQGIEPQMVWDRFIAKNLQRLAKGKEPIKIKGVLPSERMANLGRYLVAMAKEMAAQGYRKKADPNALALFRASRGPAWKPNGSLEAPATAGEGEGHLGPPTPRQLG